MGWHGTARSIRMAWLAVALVVGAAVFIPFLPFASLTVFICGVAVALFIEVRVDVDDSGVHIRSPISVPRMTIPFERVESVQAIDVRPWKRGGWGYRGSMTLFRRAAWIVRSGPGLQFELAGGRRFIVTVDGADEAARVISGRDDVETQ